MTSIQLRSDIVVTKHKSMGGDRTVIHAMLVSSDNDVQDAVHSIRSMRGRINFLMANRHGTPFEHNAFTFYIEAPVFVFREWHRHRIGWSYNEQSGRYSELPPTFYVPGVDRPLVQVGKPGEYHYIPGTAKLHSFVMSELYNSYLESYNHYKNLLTQGIAKEVSRMVLPVSIYSKMYATCNARSLMAFLSLRTFEPEAVYPSHPMYEIEQAARLTESFFAKAFPITYQAFCKNGRVSP